MSSCWIFLNDTDTIQDAFSDFYRTTILSEETDPNKLHDLQADLDGRPGILTGPDRRICTEVPRRCGSGSTIFPSWITAFAEYLGELDEDGQVKFKGKAKAFPANLRFPIVNPSFTTPNGRNAQSS